MVRVVYDPDGKIMAKEMKGEDVSGDEEMKQDSESDEDELIKQPIPLSKAKSLGLPFHHLAQN